MNFTRLSQLSIQNAVIYAQNDALWYETNNGERIKVYECITPTCLGNSPARVFNELVFMKSTEVGSVVINAITKQQTLLPIGI